MRGLPIDMLPAMVRVVLASLAEQKRMQVNEFMNASEEARTTKQASVTRLRRRVPRQDRADVQANIPAWMHETVARDAAREESPARGVPPGNASP